MRKCLYDEKVKVSVRNRLDKILFLSSLVIAYTLLVLPPIYYKVIIKQEFFGNDVSQHLLTAQNIIEGRRNIYDYPYPLMPIIYIIPSLIIKDPLILYSFGLLLSGLIIIFLFVNMYYLLSIFAKTDIATVISIIFFGNSPLLLDIIGWGGQSTLMSMLFGILSLVFISNYFKNEKNFYITLATISISLSILAEPYISLFFVFSTLILLFSRQNKGKSLIKKIIIIIIFSFLILISLYIINYKEIVHSSFIPLFLYMFNDNSIIFLILQRISFDNINIFITYITMILIYFLLNRFERKKQDYIDNIIVATGLPSLIQIFLLTPAQYADRGIVLASIPLSLILCKIIDNFVENLYNDKLVTKTLIRRLFKLIMPFILIFAIITAGLGINIYYNSFDFYHVDKELLEFTSFIKQEEGNVVLVTQKGWVFSLAYITGKSILPMHQPVWFIKKSQVESSIIASNLAWGYRYIDSGEVKIVDSIPIWAQPSPAVYVYKYPYYVELFRVSDGAMPIMFSPINNRSFIWQESPFYAKNISIWSTNNAIFSSYKYDYLIIDKVTSVKNDDGIISMNLNYTFINSFPYEITIRIFSLMIRNLILNTNYYNDTYAKVEIEQSFREPWIKLSYRTIMEYWSSNNVQLSFNYIEFNEWDIPEIRVKLLPKNLLNSISFTLKIKILDTNFKTPRIVTEDNIIKSYNIKWIIIDRNVHQDIIFRFEKSQLFEKYLESSNNKYIIFKVKN